ncbi:2-(1,2-epoxy-1,2-dihydrophenyl)acetyl-CoA isomerase PaaG [Vibrio sp. SCSIO 43137]|uniref:2-(1,2-epoxy-1,2-dihydrophenyl)acetyl-CoA isomerase PaaG n=1 Tax=Vibrio sp. SCSIO 43137 TaxID=3021011 RepID=UPI0023074B8E|nr:2-(1,2-epoxy-1,2-dihydrophenyl)acetyl-CoA isomerase PaaG [Vibrio sp. SCSIO 43137]WCE30906.1 2-(1,2-epoxy-1,2-dihydrophenyl)acetyl-CoA isomerase PaaG [Vibrio sp. SCSIO 43137]
MESPVLLTIEAGVALITLNRPKQLNSFNPEMHKALKSALRQAEQDESVRAVLLTGSGRGFCAGQDLNDRNVSDVSEPPNLGESIEKYYNPLIKQITSMPKPVIAAVNGVAAGAGCNIALACDLVLAAESASFIQAFCKIGLVPDSGGTWLLPRLVGNARAKGLMMMGNKLPARQAEEWGMIWQCVADDKLLETATTLASQLAVQPTKGLSLIKQALAHSSHNDLSQQLEVEKDLQTIAGRTEDYREGVRAFFEKRTPEFKGK